jgi:hypothetical protein
MPPHHHTTRALTHPQGATVATLRPRCVPRTLRLVLGLGFGAVIAMPVAQAQGLHVVSATRDLTASGLVYCLLPVEEHHASTALTAVVADTVRTLSECGPPWYDSAESLAFQNTSIFDDALDLHHRVSSSFGLSNPMNWTHARASSDASMTIRVEPGQFLAYTAIVTLAVLQTGSGLVTLTVRLSGPEGIVDSMSTQAGPGGYSEHSRRATWSRILQAGDYTVEAHGHSEDAAVAWGRTDAHFTFDDITAVTPVTWTKVKALYRE